MTSTASKNRSFNQYWWSISCKMKSVCSNYRNKMKAICSASACKEWDHNSFNCHMTSVCIYNFRFSHFCTLRLAWFWQPLSKHGVKLINTLFYQNKYVLTVFKYCLLLINMELLGQNIKSLYFLLNFIK